MRTPSNKAVMPEDKTDRLKPIRARLAEVREARKIKAAELAEAQRKAAEEAAAEAKRAAEQRAKAKDKDILTHEEYARAVNECDEIRNEAADSLRAFADTLLKSFYEAKKEYLSIYEDVEEVLQNTNIIAGRSAGRTGNPGLLFIGDPNALGYRAGKSMLWQAVAAEYPNTTQTEYIPPKMPVSPTAHSIAELHALEKAGIKQGGLVLEETPEPVREDWLDPSIEWEGSYVQEMTPGLNEVPARMDYTGHIQEDGVFGTDERVIIPPKE